MEYIYAAMLLHKAGQKVTEDAVKKVLQAAGVKVDDARAKALIASLEGVNIDEAVEKASFVAAPAASAAPSSAGQPEAKKEDAGKKKAEEKKTEEMAAAGLGALFG
ncbi:50S ribosomal protein P1 [Candidatus Woesearchaeota archaeon]|nr:50S ribosomal protein P1 [Candidatus Woesearchaeota archaeon]